MHEHASTKIPDQGQEWRDYFAKHDENVTDNIKRGTTPPTITPNTHALQHRSLTRVTHTVKNKNKVVRALQLVCSMRGFRIISLRPSHIRKQENKKNTR